MGVCLRGSGNRSDGTVVEVSGFYSPRGGFNFSCTLGLQGIQGKASCSCKSMLMGHFKSLSIILYGFGSTH